MKKCKKRKKSKWFDRRKAVSQKKKTFMIRGHRTSLREIVLRNIAIISDVGQISTTSGVHLYSHSKKEKKEGTKYQSAN